MLYMDPQKLQVEQNCPQPPTPTPPIAPSNLKVNRPQSVPTVDSTEVSSWGGPKRQHVSTCPCWGCLCLGTEQGGRQSTQPQPLPRPLGLPPAGPTGRCALSSPVLILWRCPAWRDEPAPRHRLGRDPEVQALQGQPLRGSSVPSASWSAGPALCLAGLYSLLEGWSLEREGVPEASSLPGHRQPS